MPPLASSRMRFALDPKNAVFKSNLGETFRTLKRYPEAEAQLRQAAGLDPTFADGICNLAVLLMELDRSSEALDILSAAIARLPAQPPLHRLKGDALVRLDRRTEALAAFEEALRLNPQFSEARFNYAAALCALGRPDEAIAHLRTVALANPQDAQTRMMLAHAFDQSVRLQEAVDEWQQAIRLDPQNAAAHAGLANTLRAGDRIDESIAAYRQALAFAPDDPAIRGNLAFALRDQARLAEAIAELRAAVEQHPDHAAVASALIFTMHLDPETPAEVIAAEKQRWNRRHLDPLSAARPPHQNDRSPDRPLNIGYVSGDLREHPVGRFMEPLLLAHDRTQVRVFCYSATLNPEPRTVSLRAAADVWRNIAGVPDDQAATVIRADEIDILVDLANHTTGNRLTLFARKPAPVQITYLAYGAGTGLSVMDWRLTDAFIDPPKPPELETPAALALLGEGPLRMARTFWCYSPHSGAAEISPLPALSAGHLTFGSLNNFAKLNDRVLALWANLLAGIPTSRLIVHVPAGSRQNHVRDFFAARRISAARLEILPRMDTDQYFETYRRIDVALDPFPWAGGTTSCDALFMGVPVITLAGSRPEETLSRGGASLLSNLALPEWIARSPAEYLAIARRAAGDPKALAALRAGLRERMKNSPLMDSAAFAQDMEQAFRHAWQAWCSYGPQP